MHEHLLAVQKTHVVVGDTIRATNRVVLAVVARAVGGRLARACILQFHVPNTAENTTGRMDRMANKNMKKVICVLCPPWRWFPRRIEGKRLDKLCLWIRPIRLISPTKSLLLCYCCFFVRKGRAALFFAKHSLFPSIIEKKMLTRSPSDSDCCRWCHRPHTRGRGAPCTHSL